LFERKGKETQGERTDLSQNSEKSKPFDRYKEMGKVAGQKERRKKEEDLTYQNSDKLKEPFVRLKEMGAVGGKGGKGYQNSDNPSGSTEPFDRYKEMGEIDEPLHY
jgi:hypothetical protein